MTPAGRERLEILARRRWRLALALTGAMLTTYFGFILLVAFDKPLMGQQLAPGLSLGSSVRRGDVIGFVGDTGHPGPGNYHLHFEIHPGGQRAAAVDPLPLLQVPSACTIT